MVGRKIRGGRSRDEAQEERAGAARDYDRGGGHCVNRAGDHAGARGAHDALVVHRAVSDDDAHDGHGDRDVVGHVDVRDDLDATFLRDYARAGAYSSGRLRRRSRGLRCDAGRVSTCGGSDAGSGVPFALEDGEDAAGALNRCS